MPSGSLQSLADARDIMDRALESEKGISAEFETHGALINFRQRCHALRSKERHLSREAFAPGHPSRNTSGYDGLRLVDCSSRGVGAEFEPPFVLKIVKLVGMMPPEIMEIKDL
jgi:hypothetical protein